MTRYSVTDEKYQKFSIDVRGTEITLVIYYIHSSDSWYRDAYDPAGNVVTLGERLVGGLDLGFKFGIPGIYIADSLGNAKDPDGTGWSDLFIYVLSEDELEDTARRLGIEPTYLIDGNSDPLTDSKGFFLVVE